MLKILKDLRHEIMGGEDLYSTPMIGLPRYPFAIEYDYGTIHTADGIALTLQSIFVDNQGSRFERIRTILIFSERTKVPALNDALIATIIYQFVAEHGLSLGLELTKQNIPSEMEICNSIVSRNSEQSA